MSSRNLCNLFKICVIKVSDIVLDSFSETSIKILTEELVYHKVNSGFSKEIFFMLGRLKNEPRTF